MHLLFISPNNVYATSRLLEECSKQGVEVTHFSSADLAAKGDVDIELFDALYVRFAYPSFDEIAALAKKFKGAGKVVVDEVIAEGDIDPDKLSDNQKLSQAGLPVTVTSALKDLQVFKFPSVVKTKYGFGKKEVFLIKNPTDLHYHTRLYDSGELIIQEFIQAQYEYKVVCAGYKALPKILRFKINSSGFGISNSGYEILEAEENPQVAALAEKASRVLGRELSKVDILQRGENFFVLEVNRSPGLRSFEAFTGLDAAEVFIKYISGRTVEKML